MTELTLDGKIYVSSKRAAEMTGYAKDYVGQLCREGRVAARLVGRNWYVLKSAIEEHRFGAAEEAEAVATPEPVEDTSWKVRYQSEQEEPLPSINRLEMQDEMLPMRDENGLAPLQEMQSTWSDWFNRSAEPVAVSKISHEDTAPDVSEQSENAPEGEILPVEEEIQSPQGRVLDLHKEPAEKQIELQDAFIELVDDEYVPNYRLLRAGLFVVIFAAVIVSYIGTGFMPHQVASSMPARLLAGVSYYNN